MEIDSGPDPFTPDDSPGREYKVSAVESVSRTFSLFFRKFGTYALVGLAAAMFALLVVIILIFTLPPLPLDDLQTIINAEGDLVAIFSLIWENFGTSLAPILFLMAILAIVGTVYYTILGGAATQIALDNYGAPQKGEFLPSISKAFSRAPTLILYQIIVTIFSVLLVLPGTIMIAPLATIDPYNPDFAVLEAAMTGALLILVGGIVLFYILVRLTPAIPVIMAEDVSAFGAISRSLELTSGNFIHIFGARIVMAIAMFVFTLAIEFALFFIPSGILYAIASLLLSAILLTSFDYIFTAVLYKDLKARQIIVEEDQGNQDWW